MPLTTADADTIRSAVSELNGSARFDIAAQVIFEEPCLLVVVVVGRRSVTVEFVEPASASAVRDMLDFAVGLLTSGGGAAGRQALPGRPMAGSEGEVRP